MLINGDHDLIEHYSVGGFDPHGGVRNLLRLDHEVLCDEILPVTINEMVS